MVWNKPINLTISNEHVPEKELQIIVIKEMERCVRHIPSFNSIPRLLLIHIIFVFVKMLNYLPTKGGVSTVYIPKTIMYGYNLHCKRHLDLKIGQYC